MEPLNVLITSVSRKVPLIKAVKQALENVSGGEVVGGDSNPNAIGRYFTDDFWQMPEDLSIDTLVEECLARQIRAIIPTRDGELAFFAKHRVSLKLSGISVMISPPEAIEISLDKLKFYESLKDHFDVVVTSDKLETLTAERYVVKERFGAASRKLFLNLTKQEAQEAANELEHPLFQPMIEGIEYSIDCYPGQGAVVRSRDQVRLGESEITTTHHMPHLQKLSLSLAKRLQLSGHVMFQVIGNQLLECNARFGGASTLSIAAGLESFVWFFLECQGKELTHFLPVKQPLTLIRHPEDFIQ